MVLIDHNKEYILLSKIKSLKSKKQMILDGESEGSLEDTEAQIRALTNLIEML